MGFTRNNDPYEKLNIGANRIKDGIPDWKTVPIDDLKTQLLKRLVDYYDNIRREKEYDMQVQFYKEIQAQKQKR